LSQKFIEIKNINQNLTQKCQLDQISYAAMFYLNNTTYLILGAIELYLNFLNFIIIIFIVQFAQH